MTQQTWELIAEIARWSTLVCTVLIAILKQWDHP